MSKYTVRIPCTVSGWDVAIVVDVTAEYPEDAASRVSKAIAKLMAPVCPCSCDLCSQGDHCGEDDCESEPEETK